MKHGGVKNRFALNHLTAAIGCAMSAAKIEEAIVENSDAGLGETIYIHEGSIERRIGRWCAIHNSHVVTSVIQCHSFLDSFINETTDRAYDIAAKAEDDKVTLTLPSNPIDEEKSKRIAEFIDTYEESGNDFFYISPFLRKYQTILSVSDAEKFNTGREPYQSTELIRRVRNYFLHHEPEWIKPEEDDTKADNLSKSLKTKPFSTSPISPDSKPFFPQRCLSSSFSMWNITSATDFTQEFCTRTDIDVPITPDDISSDLDYLEEKVREIEAKEDYR